MKTLLLIVVVALILTTAAVAAPVIVVPPGVLCTPCYGCAYAGYPCPAGWAYYYYNPDAMHSYDQNYRYGGYASPGVYTIPGGYYAPGYTYGMGTYSQFPPYLGTDASQQWFANPS